MTCPSCHAHADMLLGFLWKPVLFMLPLVQICSRYPFLVVVQIHFKGYMQNKLTFLSTPVQDEDMLLGFHWNLVFFMFSFVVICNRYPFLVFCPGTFCGIYAKQVDTFIDTSTRWVHATWFPLETCSLYVLVHADLQQVPFSGCLARFIFGIYATQVDNFMDTSTRWGHATWFPMETCSLFVVIRADLQQVSFSGCLSRFVFGDMCKTPLTYGRNLA